MSENKQTIQINAYGFHDALEKIQPYLKDNFVFDFDSNENYPRSFGTNFVFALIERDTSVATEPEDRPEELTEETKTIKVKGRTKREPTEE